MKTIFLPHSRMRARNSRSLSLKGRSALVTKSTRSARGTKLLVSSSCCRMTALVPGVSTTVSSRSSSAGWVRSRRNASSGRSVTSGPWRSRLMRSVVGVTPSGSTRSPSRALMKLDLPELNSPAITSRNNPASCSVASLNRWRSAACTSGPKPSSARARRPSSSCSRARRSCSRSDRNDRRRSSLPITSRVFRTLSPPQGRAGTRRRAPCPAGAGSGSRRRARSPCRRCPGGNRPRG